MNTEDSKQSNRKNFANIHEMIRFILPFFWSYYWRSSLFGTIAIIASIILFVALFGIFVLSSILQATGSYKFGIGTITLNIALMFFIVSTAPLLIVEFFVLRHVINMRTFANFYIEYEKKGSIIKIVFCTFAISFFASIMKTFICPTIVDDFLEEFFTEKNEPILRNTLYTQENNSINIHLSTAIQIFSRAVHCSYFQEIILGIIVQISLTFFLFCIIFQYNLFGFKLKKYKE